jgi:hypothetical protein
MRRGASRLRALSFWRSFVNRHRAEVEANAPAEAWLFAQAVLGKSASRVVSPEATADAEREKMEFPAQYPSYYVEESHSLQGAEARRVLEFAAAISTGAEAKLAAIARSSTVLREAENSYEANSMSITEWAPNQPRQPKGTPQGGQWASNGGGVGGSSFLDKVVQRNRDLADLSGANTLGIQQSSRLARELQSAARLPADTTRVAQAAADGLATGGKAVVNGGATAIKNTVTLGLRPGQLELIGVTKEDRARGYDSAVAIATASGEVLIAVGTGNLTSVLSKGGTIARAASGALVAYDAAGNAVGVIQGVYDAKKNGVNVGNGAQIVGGLLGLGANFQAARGLKSPNLLPKGFDPLQGFATFEDFKDAFGSAGSGLAWHHVVEQTINSGKFAAQLLHNPANLFKLPHGAGSIHAKISGYYSSKQRFTGGRTVREWLSKKSFKEQFEFGIQKIKEFGGAQYLPKEFR